MVVIHALLGMKWNERLDVQLQRLYSNVNKGLLVTIILAIFVQIVDWTEKLGAAEINPLDLLFNTSTGQVLLIQLLVAIIILLFKRYSKMISLVAALIMLASEAFNGHAAGVDSSSSAILFDFIHLLCISIWIGGIILMWLVWRYERDSALIYLKRFTSILWITIAFVSISGIMLIVLILPSWAYLLYTPWGQWLLIKIGLIAITIWCGYAVRKKILSQNESPKKAMLVEGGMLIAIILIASIISSVSYTPSAEHAVNLHKMGEEIHYTLKITPNAPGPNHLSLTLWTLENEGKVESVSINIQAADKEERSSRAATLQQAGLEDAFIFEGFNESRFVLPDFQIPYPSKWLGTATITFEDGHERELQFTFSNK